MRRINSKTEVHIKNGIASTTDRRTHLPFHSSAANRPSFRYSETHYCTRLERLQETNFVLPKLVRNSAKQLLTLHYTTLVYKLIKYNEHIQEQQNGKTAEIYENSTH